MQRHPTVPRLWLPLAILLLAACADPTRPNDTTTTTAASMKTANAHGAPVRLAFPGDYPGGPFYSELAPDFVFHTDREAAVVFWRQPDCVPDDFNLLDFLDLTPAFPGGPPRPFLCTFTVHGVDTWHDPATDRFPFQEEVRGSGAVPVWFVSWPELEAAIGDGVLTIAELGSLPSLRVGHASFYQELIRNSNQGNRHAGSTTNARGVLTDGSSFRLHVSEKLQGVRRFLKVLIDISGE